MSERERGGGGMIVGIQTWGGGGGKEYERDRRDRSGVCESLRNRQRQ